MLDIKIVQYEDLTQEDRKYQPNNGAGKEYANYLLILYNNESIFLHSDAMEPEDASFNRDLDWILTALQLCYDLGKKDGAIETKGGD